MNKLKPVRLAALRTEAAFLLKHLRRHPPDVNTAAQRLLQLPVFSGRSIDWLVAQNNEIKLKHAYQTLAIERGFSSWQQLKQAVVENDCLYRPAAVPFIHAWFKEYAPAETYFRQHGGYLLCFWKDFIVCGKEYIHYLGLDVYEEGWKKIGYNWVKPANRLHWQRLRQQAINNYLLQQ